MNVFILVGGTSSQEAYINDYILQNNIKQYNQQAYSESLKVAHVRELKKSLSIKRGRDEKRVITVANEITLVAQHALLKTLEELPEYVTLFILTPSKELLLPTLLSRAKVVQLIDENVSDNELVISVVEKLLSGDRDETLLSVLSFSERFAFEKESKELEDIILALRKYIVRAIDENTEDTRSLFKAIRLLRELHEKYYLVEQNNVNKKTLLEISTFTSLS